MLAAAMLLLLQSPEQLFRDAVAAQQRGDDLTAIRLYGELLKARPDVLEVRTNLGAALARAGRLDEAIEQYRAVLARQDNPGLRLNLALAYYKKDALPDAIRELTILRRADPASLRIAMLLADCHFRLGQTAEVLSVLQPLERAHPNDPALAWLLGSTLIRGGRRSEGLPRVEKAAALAANAEAYVLAGQTALELSEFEKARDHARAALRINPKVAGGQTLLGTVLQYLGDNQNAIEALRKALDGNPDDADAHLTLGAVLHTERDLDGARTHLERALRLNPKSLQAHYQRARLFRTEGDLESAAKGFEYVIRENPAWDQPHLDLSVVYFRLNRNEEAEREKALFDKLSAAKKP